METTGTILTQVKPHITKIHHIQNRICEKILCKELLNSIGANKQNVIVSGGNLNIMSVNLQVFTLHDM
jgi:hypothetical protein